MAEEDLETPIEEWFEEEAEPSPGDEIEFPRGFYSHWAIYAGDGYMIHRDGKGENWATRKRDAAIFLDHISLVVNGKKQGCRVNNRKESELSSEEIVERARERVGEGGYHLLEKNCEHFCGEIRYGEPWSLQVESLKNGKILDEIKEKFGDIDPNDWRVLKFLDNMETMDDLKNIGSVLTDALDDPKEAFEQVQDTVKDKFDDIDFGQAQDFVEDKFSDLKDKFKGFF